MHSQLTSILLTGIKLNLTNTTILAGDTFKLKTTITPANAGTKMVTFATANKKICTVDKNGIVTAIKAGKTEITAVSVSNTKIVAKCTVIVLAPTKRGESWTWDTSPFETTWYTGIAGYAKEWKPNDVLFDKVVTEKTGVKNIVFSSPSDGQDKLGAMIASNNLPDILTVPITEPIYKLIQNSGLVYPLFDLIDQYAPTFRKNIPESMVSFHSAENGEFYAMINGFLAPEQIWKGFSYGQDLSMSARDDIMAKLNIKAEDFKTQDGMINALKKVKDAKLKNEEGLDILPIVFSTCQSI